MRCKRTSLEGTDPPLCVSHIGVVGRKTLLDDEVIGRLEALLKVGNYIDVACAAVGVARSTFYDWWKRGDPDGTIAADLPFRVFRARLEAARDHGEAVNVTLIANAGRKDWRAAAWILERSAPERWARPVARQGETDDDDHPRRRPAGAGDEEPEDPFTALERDELAQRRASRRGAPAEHA